jgi:hypothetical protein
MNFASKFLNSDRFCAVCVQCFVLYVCSVLCSMCAVFCAVCLQCFVLYVCSILCCMCAVFCVVCVQCFVQYVCSVFSIILDENILYYFILSGVWKILFQWIVECIPNPACAEVRIA